jgi:hypothetical protein
VRGSKNDGWGRAGGLSARDPDAVAPKALVNNR